MKQPKSNLQPLTTDLASSEVVTAEDMVASLKLDPKPKEPLILIVLEALYLLGALILALICKYIMLVMLVLNIPLNMLISFVYESTWFFHLNFSVDELEHYEDEIQEAKIKFMDNIRIQISAVSFLVFNELTWHPVSHYTKVIVLYFLGK